jgi:hypothetical protein
LEACRTHLDGGNLVNVGLDGFGELDHKLSTLATGFVETPNGLVSLLGSVDGAVDILGRGLGDLSNLFACGRVDDLVCSAKECVRSRGPREKPGPNDSGYGSGVRIAYLDGLAAFTGNKLVVDEET